MSAGDLDTSGQRTSSEPIEGGVCILNAAVAPGHDEHEVWRPLSNKEARDRVEEGKAFAIRSDRARRAMLRIERNRRLVDTDWTELPSAKDRVTAEELLAWELYRQELRDLPANTPDPDAPTWPESPATSSTRGLPGTDDQEMGVIL